MNALRNIVTLYCIVMSMVVATAQNYKVSGSVTDTTGVGESYATIRIYSVNDTLKPIVVGVTTIDGDFDQTLPKAGSYRLNVHSVGKAEINKSFEVTSARPVVALGTLVAHEKSQTLREIEVVAQRPLVSREIDRIGYDVQADEESKTSTVIEMLRKVPMVSVDGNDQITVRGSSNFKIYKNGRPNGSFSNNPKEVLSSIPASMIKRIEVITEPGAKYDAEGMGAIINIVTLDDVATKGIVGNANVSSNTVNPVPGASLWLTSQIDKLTLSFNAGYNYMNSRSTKNHQYSHYDYESTGSSLELDSKGDNPGDLMYISTEASYELDSLNLFTAEFGGYYFDVNARGEQDYKMLDADGGELYSYQSKYNYPSYSYFDFSGNFNYQRLTKRKGESLTLSYMLSTTNQSRDQHVYYDNMVNAPFDYTQNNSTFDLNFVEHTFQFDWVRPFAKVHQIDLGAKYILRDNHSKTRQEYIPIDTTNSDFAHITDVAALYADYRVNLGKWNVRGGLRYEYSHLEADFKDGSNPNFGRHLNDWVPSAAISWRPDDKSSFTLNYATRINRPGISYLNPAVEATPSHTSQGNPGLESARHNSVKLSYMFIKPLINFNLSLGYEASNNEITSYKYVVDDHIYSTYGNIGDSRNISLSGYLQWTITPKTTVMINGMVGHKRYANDALGANLSRWQVQAYGQFTQQLPWKLRVELSGYWSNGFFSDAYSYTTFPKAVYHTLSLRRSFLKEDRLTVVLSADNLFGPSKGEFSEHIVNGDYTGEGKFWQFNQRKAQIRIAYRFGSLKAQVKKTAKTIENDDLIGRKK